MSERRLCDETCRAKKSLPLVVGENFGHSCGNSIRKTDEGGTPSASSRPSPARVGTIIMIKTRGEAENQRWQREDIDGVKRILAIITTMWKLLVASASLWLLLLPATSDAQFNHVEETFLSMPDRASARANLRFLTSQPHVAGTVGDHVMAEFVSDQFERAGIPDVSTFDLDVLLNYPGSSSALWNCGDRPTIKKWSFAPVSVKKSWSLTIPVIRSGETTLFTGTGPVET